MIIIELINIFFVNSFISFTKLLVVFGGFLNRSYAKSGSYISLIFISPLSNFYWISLLEPSYSYLASFSLICSSMLNVGLSTGFSFNPYTKKAALPKIRSNSGLTSAYFFNSYFIIAI